MDEYTFQHLPRDVVFQLLADLINAKGSAKRAAQQKKTVAAIRPQPQPGEGTASESLGAVEAEATGKMSKEMSGTLGALSTARSIAATALGLLGYGVPALGPIGWGLTAMRVANQFADPYESNPLGGAPSPQSIEAARDISGMFAASDLASQRDQAIAEALAMDETGWTAGLLSQLAGLGSMAGGWEGTPQGFGSTSLSNAIGTRSTAGDYSGTTPGGWEGAPSAPSPSVSNPDSPFGNTTESGANGPGGTTDGGQTGPGGHDGESASGEGRGGDTDWKGGVRVGTPKRPGRTVFGKLGRETAIFIPDRMQLPGLQENEAMVRTALRRKLSDLLADRRARSTR